MPAYEAQMSKGRTPRRALSRALLFALACSTVLAAESGSAAAFEIFGIKLWGSSDNEDADIVDPLRYSVSIEAPDADKDLVKKLENASTLKADEERPVSGSLGLLAKARSDLSLRALTLKRTADSLDADADLVKDRFKGAR